MALSVVQTLSVQQSLGGSFASNVTAGNSIIIALSSFTTSSATLASVNPTFNGSAVTGAVLLVHAQSTTSGTNQVYGAIWLLPNVTGGAKPIAYSMTGSPGSAMAIGFTAWEVSGLGASPSLDQLISGNGASGTTLSSGTTGAITGNPEFIAAMACSFGNAITKVGAPWTEVNSAGGTDSIQGEQIVTSSGGTFSYAPVAAGSAGWVSMVATISGASGPTAGAATLAAAGSLTSNATLGAGKTLGGAGSLTDAGGIGSGGTLGGAGSIGAPLATLGVKATLAAAGSLTSADVQGARATLGAVGSLTGKAAQGAGATLNGTGSVAAAVTQVVAGTSLPGAGSLTANAGGNISGGATLGGAGSLTAPDVTQLAPATLAAAGSLTASKATLVVAATLAGTGSLTTAKATLVAGAVLVGAGSISGTGGGATHNAVSSAAVTAGRMSTSQVSQKAAAVPTVSGG